MIVKPSEFMDADTRFKRWGKLFNVSQFDPGEKGGYSLKGTFVKWNESVSLGHGQFMVVACQFGSRRKQTYAYCLVMGGDKPVIIRRLNSTKAVEHDLWKEFTGDRENVFAEDVVAKSKNNVLYAFGLFSVWMEQKADADDGKAMAVAPDLSRVSDDDLVAELQARGGWIVEREPDGGHKPDTILGFDGKEYPVEDEQPPVEDWKVPHG